MMSSKMLLFFLLIINFFGIFYYVLVILMDITAWLLFMKSVNTSGFYQCLFRPSTKGSISDNIFCKENSDDAIELPSPYNCLFRALIFLTIFTCLTPSASWGENSVLLLLSAFYRGRKCWKSKGRTFPGKVIQGQDLSDAGGSLTWLSCADLSLHSAVLHRKNRVLLFCKWPLTELCTEKCEVTKMWLSALQ